MQLRSIAVRMVARRARWLGVVLVLVLVLVAAPASADDQADAAKLYQAGEQAYRMSNFAGAAQNFESAYQKLPVPEIAFSAAQAYRLQFQIDQQPANARRAIELYELYAVAVSQGKRAGDAAIHLDNLRAAYRDLVAQGKAKDDRIAIERTQLTVWVPVETAEITIDGNPASPYEYVDVAAGEHVVEVTAKGYAPFAQKVSVARGAKVPVPVQLMARPAMVKLDVEAGARIAIDGRVVRKIDGAIEVPAGKRFLTITRRGRKAYSRELDLGPGATVALEARLETSGQRTAARWALLGSGVLVGVTAATAAFTLYAQGKAETQFGVPLDDTGAYAAWRGRRDTGRTASFVLASATVVTAGTGLALYLLDTPSAEAAPPTVVPGSPDDEIRFTPIAVAGGLGLAIGGGW